MPQTEGKFELPAAIESYLGLLSKLYRRQNQAQKLAIIANSELNVQENWDSDWGVTGHALHFRVPEVLYLEVLDQRESMQGELAADLNKIHNSQDERIARVFLDPRLSTGDNWRAEAGALRGARAPSAPEAKRVWGREPGYRVFLSHVSAEKVNVAALKERLRLFGVSAFVAHEDIAPTAEWQNEIENALASMDAFVAVLSESFHRSKWTDQEVGFALARGVPIIALKLGCDPYGFIGKFQALSCSWSEAGSELVKVLIGNEKMLNAYISSLPKCESFDRANQLASVLHSIERLNGKQAQRIVEAYNANPQLQGGYGFNGGRPTRYGGGVARLLSKATGQAYEFDVDGALKRASK